MNSLFVFWGGGRWREFGWDGGMMKLNIFRGHRKTGLFLGVISKHSRFFF